jgi:hypothetical protein
MPLPTLSQLLRGQTDPVLLPVFAQAWGVKATGLSGEPLKKAILEGMLDPARAETVWDALDDHARGAMHMLSGGAGKMPEKQFERLFGEIHEMGTEKIAQEKPLQRPKSTADALYYRGLIHKSYENASTGTRTIIFIPDDLRAVLPLHKTSYDNVKDLPPEADEAAWMAASEGIDAAVDIPVLDNVTGQRPADTSFVDDITTLLAYVRIVNPTLDGSFLSQDDMTQLERGLIVQDRRRLYFLTALVQAAGLIDIHQGRALPHRTAAQPWLAAPRHEQVRVLVEAWRTTRYIIDLSYVPGLKPDMDAGDMRSYDPAAAREVIIDMMASLLPQEGWWPRDMFIEAVHEENADFQRPNGDFNSWYIRGADGQYLNGYESWHDVEGAMLEYLLTGPFHWLGLVDNADNAGRFTAYGLAFLKLKKWPTPPEQPDKVEVTADGMIYVSRRASRMDRYTVSRMTTWVSAPGAQEARYAYKLDGGAVERAAAQGINAAQISGTLVNLSGGPLPPNVARLLERWRGGASASVTFERLLVLRTSSPDVLDQIYNDPGLRRYLGARLGEMAAIIRADQADGLRAALAELSIQADYSG